VNGDLPPEVWAEREVAATLNLNDLGSESRAVELVTDTMPSIATETTVRRLTPMECERLQGFPDGHTATSNGQPQADSPRYKQMGNSVAVPCVEWITRRIVRFDA
jgi:DNA (cytosine-5)-methyltransferase 1